MFKPNFHMIILYKRSLGKNEPNEKISTYRNGQKRTDTSILNCEFKL